MPRLIVTWLALLVVAVPPASAQSSTAAAAIDVYRTVVADSRCTNRSVQSPSLLLGREFVIPITEWWATGGPSDLATTLRSVLPGLHEDAVDAFVTGGGPDSHPTTGEVARLFGGATIGGIDIEVLQEQGSFWDVFYRAHPNASGITRVSRVAFDEAMTEALLYCGVTSGELAGHGFIVRLRKAPDGWTPVAWLLQWGS